MKCKQVFILVAFLIISMGSISQPASTSFAKNPTYSKKIMLAYKNAEAEFKAQRFGFAIPLFNRLLKKTGMDSSILFRLSESYYRVKEYDSAFKYYTILNEYYPDQIVFLDRLAELQLNKRLYKNAEKSFSQILKLRDSDRKAANRLYGINHLLDYYQDSSDYIVKFLSTNSEQSDFSPYVYKGNLLLISNRFQKERTVKLFGWDALPFSNIYVVKDTSVIQLKDTADLVASLKNYELYRYNNDNTSRTSNDNDVVYNNIVSRKSKGNRNVLFTFSNDLRSKYNYGPLCFNPEGTKVYFTRNKLKTYEGRYNLEICEASLKKGKWTDIKVLPFVGDQYDYFHPAISSDGKILFFCSNKTGGYGGVDLYYADIVDGQIKPNAISLGRAINSEADELFPTINQDTLYFSSNGLFGLGGLDVYKVTVGENGWNKPINMGYPINSSYDDFGFVYTPGIGGFFSSNRRGNDDIYAVKKNNLSIPIQTVAINKVSKLRVSNVLVTLEAIDNKSLKIDTVLTDFTGNVKFRVKPNHPYMLRAFYKDILVDSFPVNAPPVNYVYDLKPVLIDSTIPVTTALISASKKINTGISKDSMNTILKRINELAKNIYFKTASAELNSRSYKSLYEILHFMNKFQTLRLTVEGHTDNQGDSVMNQGLSERRVKSVVDFLTIRGVDAARLSTSGYGLTKPVATNNTPEGRAKNRRVEMVGIFEEQE